MDRRGFVAAMNGLDFLWSRQLAEGRQHGVCGTSLLRKFPNRSTDPLNGRDEITLIVSDDRTAWWAWRRAPSGFVFGVAGKARALDKWNFASFTPPRGVPHEDDRWRSILRDEPPLDWTSRVLAEQ
jgi:hypothetical protein